MTVLNTDAAAFERRRHFKFYTVLVVFFVSLGTCSYGTSAAIISTTLGQPSFFVAMGLNDSNMASLTGAMNSLYYAGGIFGAICHGLIADRYGRKWDIFVGSTFVLVSQALITGSVNPAMFIVFRFFAGWGGFQLVAAVPMWIAEIVPPAHRGMLSDIAPIMINVGYTLTGYVGVGFYFFDSKDAWRGPMALTMIPPLILCCGIYWIPESPRYLLLKDRYEEAWAIIARLHSDPRDPHNEFAKREYYQMQRQIKFDASLNTGYKEIFTRPSYRKRAFISIILMVCVMSSGVLTIQNYGVSLYAKLGYDNLQTLLFQTGYTATALCFSIVAMTYVDRVKRNYLIGVGFCGCGIAVILETALTANFLNSDNKAGLGAAVFAFFLYVVFFELCLDGPEFFYHSEIWPTHMRAKGYTLCVAFYSGINIVWLQAAPTAFAHIGWKYYIFFILFAALGAFCAFFIFPDTLHKPLEEVAAIFGDHDLVIVYQKELDSAHIALETIEEIIPGMGPKQVDDASLEKEGPRTAVIEDVGTQA
ncbi:hypothetical protein CLAIMM_00770 [Cladophialophora immunda]|nr:hypothetical protein CLAIMM_00770 [Cladophialophora immunda]